MNPQKETILAIDDDPVFLELLAATFDKDYRVLQAKDGADGLRLAREELPHLILLDLMMPLISGLEVVRGLQADMDTRAIPVILLTGCKMAKSTENMLRDNVNVVSFINKPCSFDTLTSQVRAALDHRITAELDDKPST